MFRFTVQGKHVEQFRQAIPNELKPVWRRVYRWENVWGMSTGGFEGWSAEIRTFLASSDDTQLLEQVETIQTPLPSTLDDVWDEEVYILPNNVVCGNILSVRGSIDDIIRFCAQNRIVLSAKFLECMRTAPQAKAQVQNQLPAQLQSQVQAQVNPQTHRVYKRPDTKQSQQPMRRPTKPLFVPDP